MILTTTHEIEGRRIERYLGIVFGEAIVGANVLRELLAQIRETALAEMAEAARRLGADAVVGVDLDYEVLGSGNSMLMVTASGTAVKLAP